MSSESTLRQPLLRAAGICNHGTMESRSRNLYEKCGIYVQYYGNEVLHTICFIRLTAKRISHLCISYFASGWNLKAYH